MINSNLIQEIHDKPPTKFLIHQTPKIHSPPTEDHRIANCQHQTSHGTSNGIQLMHLIYVDSFGISRMHLGE